jgi:ABC-type nitrate/sulfonate/bicarbonate transport system permease component
LSESWSESPNAYEQTPGIWPPNDLDMTSTSRKRMIVALSWAVLIGVPVALAAVIYKLAAAFVTVIVLGE